MTNGAMTNGSMTNDQWLNDQWFNDQWCLRFVGGGKLGADRYRLKEIFGRCQRRRKAGA
jgi:hypothetical protein